MLSKVLAAIDVIDERIMNEQHWFKVENGVQEQRQDGD